MPIKMKYLCGTSLFSYQDSEDKIVDVYQFKITEPEYEGDCRDAVALIYDGYNWEVVTVDKLEPLE